MKVIDAGQRLYRPDGADPVWRGCCTFVLHMTPSSRSQVAVPTASGAACLTWGTIVRQCPLASSAGDGDSYSLGYSVAREFVS